MRADGIQWRSYDKSMQKYIKQIGDERLERVPKDLDLKPYRDEHDHDLLARMKTSMRAGLHPPRTSKHKPLISGAKLVTRKRTT